MKIKLKTKRREIMELVYETLPIIGILVGIFIIGVFSVVGSLIMINNVLNKPIKAEVDFVKEQAISTKKDMEDIKKQVYNHIPTEIKKIQEDNVKIIKVIELLSENVNRLLKLQEKKPHNNLTPSNIG